MLSRNITSKVNYVLDHLCPPILRDCKWFMYPIVRFAYGKRTSAIMQFKDKLPFMSERELARYYELIADAPINQRRTDLNGACMEFIVRHIVGETVLDAACGRGALLEEVAAHNKHVRCTGVDIVKALHGFPFIQASLTDLPMEDKSFDTVLCTHALEHIRDPQQALSELLRITRRRLIIVVPRQREYRFTVDLHVNFFPYLYDFQSFIGRPEAKYMCLGGDFLCVIDKGKHGKRGE